MSIAAVIPAYNEENSIGHVLNTVVKTKQISNIFSDIIVVSDGSTDRTAEIAWSYGARVIELPSKHGQRLCNENRPGQYHRTGNTFSGCRFNRTEARTYTEPL